MQRIAADFADLSETDKRYTLAPSTTQEYQTMTPQQILLKATAKQLDALIGKRVTLAHREQPRTGTVQSISHGVNATVAVRFDTDSYDTHLPPPDLKVIA